MALCDPNDGTAASWGLATAPVVAIAGSIIGYELWDGHARAADDVQIMPTASFDGQTGTVGVTGQF